MTHVLALAKGESAEIAITDGDQVTLRSSIPSPPGSSLEGSFDGHTLRVKVRGCRKDPKNPAERAFTIEGRFVSLTKAQRAAILGESEPGDPSPRS
jgi:hypothetical protein